MSCKCLFALNIHKVLVLYLIVRKKEEFVWLVKTIKSYSIIKLSTHKIIFFSKSETRNNFINILKILLILFKFYKLECN